MFATIAVFGAWTSAAIGVWRLARVLRPHEPAPFLATRPLQTRPGAAVCCDLSPGAPRVTPALL